MLDFLIIGAQKAATTALQTALRRHPGICMPTGESAIFEEPDYAQRRWERLGDDEPAGVVKGIKRPNYLCSDQAIEHVSDALPEARLIVVLREPISRAVSSYYHLVRHAQLPFLPLDAGMNRCLDAFEAGDASLAASIVRFGLYGRYLELWYARYPRGRFLILAQQFVSDNPGHALRRCATHLGVDPESSMFMDASRQAIERKNVGLYDARLLRIGRLASVLKTRAIPGSTRREPRGLLLCGVGTVIARTAELAALRRGQHLETLAPETRDRLAAIYAEDLVRLKALAPTEALYWA